MGLFDLFKKKPVQEVNSFGQRYDCLTEDGELPWGWAYRNKEFTDAAQAEVMFFYDEYYKHRYGEPRKKYAALKSLLLYIDDAKKIYAKKGECFLFWFVNLWAKDEEVQQLTEELRYIEEHFDELEEEYKKDQYIQNVLIPDLTKKVLELVKNNPGILQTEAYTYFEPEVKDYVQGVFRNLSNEGKIKREKHGRTFKLYI